jgi:putative transposase
MSRNSLRNLGAFCRARRLVGGPLHFDAGSCTFFARPEIDARPMAAWVQMWKSVSSRRIAAALVIRQPIWQAEYFDRYLRSMESYSEKWDYVEQNAVRADLVGTVEAWPYCGTITDLTF